MKLFSVLVLLLVAQLLGAASIEQLDVWTDNGVYRLHLKAHPDGPVDDLWTILDNFANLPRMLHTVTAVELRPGADPNQRRVEIRMYDCVLFYCRRFHHVQDVVKLAPYSIIALIDPNDSDYRGGWARWQMGDQPDGETWLDIQIAVIPDFWVPPLIGPWILRRKLRQEGLELLRGIETLHRMPALNALPE